MEKILSISIAAYNVSEYIETCLDSFVAAKNLDKVEVIVVDDGSKDNTADIVRTYVEKYPESIKLIAKENGGHGSTINAGIAAATGKYFKIVDGDDWVDADALDRLVEFLQETDVDLVINDYNRVYPDSIERENARRSYELNKVYSFEDMDPQYYFRMHSTTVKLATYKSVAEPITEKCFYVDLEYLFFIAMAVESVVFHGASVYQYRLGRDGQSMSPVGMYNHFEDLIRTNNRMTEMYANLQLPDSTRKQYLFHLLDMRVKMVYANCLNMMKHDKDFLLKEYNDRLHEQYPALLAQIHLGVYRTVSINCSVALFCGRLLKYWRNAAIDLMKHMSTGGETNK